MYDAYEEYFRTDNYDLRYPRPNRATLRSVLAASRPGDRVLDIGAGNGRYAIPLAEHNRLVTVVERSNVARAQLADRASHLRESNPIGIYATLEEVPPRLVESSALVLVLFGVLGHMTFHERRKVLTQLAHEIPKGRRLIGSVPNRYRRFVREQDASPIIDAGNAPRFHYTRKFVDGLVSLECTAFSPTELRNELASFGWRCSNLRPESVFTESTVTHRRMASRFDNLLSRALPGRLGYCIYFDARNQVESEIPIVGESGKAPGCGHEC